MSDFYDEKPKSHFIDMAPMFITLNGIEAQFITNQLQGLYLILKALKNDGYEFDPDVGPVGDQMDDMMHHAEQGVAIIDFRGREGLN